MTCSWSLPYPVGVNVNSLYERMGHRRRLSPKARAWKDEAIIIMREQGGVIPDGNLSLSLYLYPPANGRRSDVDGPIKLAMDAVAAAFDFDDYRFASVWSLRIANHCFPGGRIDVLVLKELTND